MTSILRRFFFIVLTITASASLAQTTDTVTGRVIVKLKAGSSTLQMKSFSESSTRLDRAKALAARVGVPLDAGPAVSPDTQVVTATGMTSEELAQRLGEDIDIEYAVVDQRRRGFAIPNDPLYLAGSATGPAVGQWYLRPPSGEVKSAIDAESAWDITVGSPDVIIADIDSGVRFEHPDLLTIAAGGNLLPGYDFISDVNVANDGDGRDPDASDPGDWVTQTELSNRRGPFFQCAPGPENSSWHGTQVAGLIAAITNNGIGMASVARTVRLLPVRALGKCGGFDSDIIAAMRWSAGFPVPGVPTNPSPARIINMSLGGEGACTPAYQQAVDELTALNVVIVASAGNSAGHAVGTPANCNSVIAVGGLRHAGTKVGFSDLGANIAISAPAGNCVNTTPGTPCLYPILTTTNLGVTTPGASGYSDSFKPSVGTSFSAPLVAGTVGLMLSVRPALTSPQVKQILQATARMFPTTGGDNGDGTVVPQCTAPQFDASGQSVDQLQCYCTTSTCGAGMLDAHSAVLAASSGAVVSPAPFEGQWSNAPAGSESGWGINIAQQGDVLFVTWFTYDSAGNPWWLSITATKTAPNTYAGTVLQTHGPPFSAVPFDPAAVTRSPVGTATLTFTGANDGSFSYTVNGVSQTKNITRIIVGDVLTCASGLLQDLSVATTYQDIWWAAPAGSESGWGLNIVQQSDVIFGTWFTYATDGSPLWLLLTAHASAPGRYAGTLYRTTGPAFDTQPFDPARVTLTAVGSASLAFADGNSGTFTYTFGGVTQSKSITRQVFQGAGTTCR